jgi:putative ABC transport system permease protein
VIRLSGRLRSALVIGMQGIRARKIRTLLSMMSLFLGVLAVVAVQAAAEIGQRTLLANVELNEGRDGTVRMFLPTDPQTTPIILDTLRGRGDAVATFSTSAIIGEPGVRPINPGGSPFDQPGGGPQPAGPQFAGPNGPYLICNSQGNCVKGPDAGGDATPPGAAIELNLTAMTGDVRQFRPYRPVSGQWLDFASGPSLAPRIVLNKAAAAGFARYRVPAQMHVDGATADATPQIVGVVDDGNDQPAAYVRADELLNWLPQASLASSGSDLQVLLSPTATDTQRVLRARLIAGGLTEDKISTEPINSKARIASELSLMRWVFLGMAGLVLLIGVAGILNVGLATVGERVEEFALRRAVGTPRSLLAAIVLAETLLTGLLTAAAAVGVGMLALRLLGGMLGGRQPLLQHIEFPWQAGAAGVVAGLVAGLLGGLIPAIRAARIPIASIMRA